MDRAVFIHNTLRDFVSHFILRIEEQNVIRGMQIDVCRFPLAAKGFTGTGSAKHHSVGALERFAVSQNHPVCGGV